MSAQVSGEGQIPIRSLAIAASGVAEPQEGHCALFRGLQGQTCYLLQSQGRALDRPAGALLFDEGDEATHVHVVAAGVVQEYKMLPDGRRIITAFHYPGDLVGMTFENVHSCAAEAVTNVMLRRFPRKLLADYNEQLPDFYKRLLSHLSHELSLAHSHVLSLGRKTAIERVASFLIELADRAAREGGTYRRLWLPMRREAIADHLGLTLETVSRVFSRLRRERIISTEQHGYLELLDIDALHDLASE